MMRLLAQMDLRDPNPSMNELKLDLSDLDHPSKAAMESEARRMLLRQSADGTRLLYDIKATRDWLTLTLNLT